MNIKCINNTVKNWNDITWSIPGLTQGQTYELVEYDQEKDESLILDDNGKLVWFEGWRFVS